MKRLILLCLLMLASMPLNAEPYRSTVTPAPISSDNGVTNQIVEKKIDQSIDLRIDQKIKVIRDDAQQQLDYSAMRYNHQSARYLRAKRLSADQRNLNDLACIAFGRNCR